MKQDKQVDVHLAAPGGQVPSAASKGTLCPVAGAASTEQERPLDADAQAIEAAMRAAIAAMSPEDQRQLARSLCVAVDVFAKTIIENADEIWATGGEVRTVGGAL